MLGRRRTCSLDSLERPPSKIIKDDELSIYEATLRKLRLGSRRAFASSSEAMKLEVPSLPSDSSCSPSQTIDSKQMESPKTDCSKQMEVDSAYPSILRYCTVHADNARSSPISE